MEKYVLGLDGGGTSCNACATDLNGKVLLRDIAGSININGVSENYVRAELSALLARIYSEMGDMPEFIVIGVAGISNPRTKEVMMSILHDTGYRGKVIITGDFKIALYAKLGILNGVLLISGTGSIAYGINSRGDEIRVGGYGHIIDDLGSAYAIGRDILASVIKYFDGRNEATVLTDLVMKKLEISSIDELISYIYSPERKKSDIAALAALVEPATRANDKTAIEIQEKAAKDLADLVETIIKRMDEEEIKLAFSGSVLEKNNFIRESLVKNIEQLNTACTIEIVDSENDAAYGAALLALEELFS